MTIGEMYNQGIEGINVIKPEAIKWINELDGNALFVPKWLWCNNHFNWISNIFFAILFYCHI